jgi:hypothetical protein
VAKNVDSYLPRDGDDHAIQVLAPSSIANIAVTASSAQVTIPTGAQIVEIGASTDCWIVWGTNPTAANSTGMFVPKGTVVYKVPDGATKIAAIQDSANGRISVTQLV